MPTVPKCSLLVLTYNQQAFVGAALDAAFAQTGGPFEIIVSDDASTDDTFVVIEERVARYGGPHRVVVNRNAANMGVIAHTNRVVELATADILIPCYGDDVSFPDRATRIVEVFERHDPLLTHSHAIPIDENGRRVVSGYVGATFFDGADPLRAAVSLSHYLGASGAWSRALFDKYGPIRSPIVYDDLVLGFRAALEGRVHLIDEPLLYYREGVGISHLKREDKSRAANRIRRTKILRLSCAVFEERLTDARRFGLPEAHPIITRLKRALMRDRARLAYHENRRGLLSAIPRHPGLALEATVSEMLHDLRKR